MLFARRWCIIMHMNVSNGLILRVAVAAVFLLALSTTSSGANSRLPGLPPLPGIPSVPNANQAVSDAVAKQIVAALDKTFNDDAPIRISVSDAFPTIASLPGGNFSPASGAAANFALQELRAGDLRPGDYAIAARGYCMNVHAHAPSANTFRLAPLRGKWADIVIALNARAPASSYSPVDVQVLSWSLQAGMKYAEMSSRSKTVVDALLPEFKPRLQQSFYEQLQSTFNRLAAVPGAPSFDAILDRMGETGAAIRAIRDARATLIADADDYDRLVTAFNLGRANAPGDSGITPWSIVANDVYARLIAPGSFLDVATVEVRVGRTARVSLAYSGGGLDLPVAPLAGLWLAQSGSPVDPSQWVGVPSAAVQPLSLSPTQTPAPTPSPCTKDLTAPGNLFYGVPKGSLMQDYKPCAKCHGGIDVQQGTARGVPVYLDLRDQIDLSSIPGASTYGSGPAQLVDVHTNGIIKQPYNTNVMVTDKNGNPVFNDGYGGAVDMNAHYSYQRADGSTGTLNLRVEYEHLITPDFPPYDNDGKPIPFNDPCATLGPDMTNKSLTPDQVGKHPLVGYLGATQHAHVHVQIQLPSGSYIDPKLVLGSGHI
jgi:hypothetical protein